MVNTNKLKGRIVERGLTLRRLSDELGMSPATLGRKIKNKSPMTLEEVEALRDFLEIAPCRIMEYFFVEHMR